MRSSSLVLGLSVLLFAAAAPAPAKAQTLDAIKARGAINCGVNEGLEGFAAKDASGQWHGFDVDFCRAVAAAVFGDAGKVAFVPLSTAARFEALRDGKIDVLVRNSSQTLGRELDYGI